MSTLSPVDIKANISKQLPTIMIGSLTLIAGLAWNEAFQKLINYYVPEKYRGKDNVWFKVCYAFILTVTIIIVITVILKFSSKENQ